MRYPLNDIILAHPFGEPRPGGPHNGVDYVSKTDQYCYAIEDGRIERRFDNISGWGVNLVSVDGKRKWEYLHLFEAGRAPNGATVKEGERIGKWGETKVANVSGPHLHLGLQIPYSGPQLDGHKYIGDNMDEMITSEGQFTRLSLQFRGKKPTATEIKGYVGKRTYAYTVAKFSAVRIDLPGLLAKNAKLQAQLEASAKPLAPGKYLVK